jgi:hypothetical protein
VNSAKQQAYVCDVALFGRSPPTFEEFEAGVRACRNGKGVNREQIPGELWKHSERARRLLWKLMVRCWRRMQESESALEGPDIDEVVDELHRLVPGDWTAGTLVCLFKGKGSRSDPAAYRGISLLSSVEKIVSAALLARLRPLADERMLQNQAGFRQKKSCRDAVFAAWRSLE